MTFTKKVTCYRCQSKFYWQSRHINIENDPRYYRRVDVDSIPSEIKHFAHKTNSFICMPCLKQLREVYRYGLTGIVDNEYKQGSVYNYLLRVGLNYRDWIEFDQWDITEKILSGELPLELFRYDGKITHDSIYENLENYFTSETSSSEIVEKLPAILSKQVNPMEPTDREILQERANGLHLPSLRELNQLDIDQKIKDTLRQCDYNKTATAKMLGMSRQGIGLACKRLNIDTSNFIV